MMLCARLALFGFVVFLFTLIWLADAGRGQWLFNLARLLPGGDKAGHFILFGLLSGLLNVVLRAVVIQCGKLPVLKGSFIVALVAVAEEISQLCFSTRTFDLLDLGAGLVGIWIFGRLASRCFSYQPALAVRSSRLNGRGRDVRPMERIDR
jgi:hypothetical protein